MANGGVHLGVGATAVVPASHHMAREGSTGCECVCLVYFTVPRDIATHHTTAQRPSRLLTGTRGTRDPARGPAPAPRPRVAPRDPFQIPTTLPETPGRPPPPRPARSRSPRCLLQQPPTRGPRRRGPRSPRGTARGDDSAPHPRRDDAPPPRPSAGRTAAMRFEPAAAMPSDAARTADGPSSPRGRCRRAEGRASRKQRSYRRSFACVGSSGLDARGCRCQAPALNLPGSLRNLPRPCSALMESPGGKRLSLVTARLGLSLHRHAARALSSPGPRDGAQTRAS